MTDLYRQTSAELARSGLSAASWLRLSVVSNSMAPMLRSGDKVIVQPARTVDLRQGDVIVAQRDGEMITHRLVAIDAAGWHTKGDNCAYPDQPLAAQSILGRVVTIERKGQSFDLLRRRWLMVNRLLGRLSWLQVRVLQQGRQIKSEVIGEKPRRWTSLLTRLVSVPFQILIRLILWLPVKS